MSDNQNNAEGESAGDLEIIFAAFEQVKIFLDIETLSHVRSVCKNFNSSPIPYFNIKITEHCMKNEIVGLLKQQIILANQECIPVKKMRQLVKITCEYGYANVFRLLENRIHISVKKMHQLVKIACERGHVDIVRCLINHKDFNRVALPDIEDAKIQGCACEDCRKGYCIHNKYRFNCKLCSEKYCNHKKIIYQCRKCFAEFSVYVKRKVVRYRMQIGLFIKIAPPDSKAEIVDLFLEKLHELNPDITKIDIKGVGLREIPSAIRLFKNLYQLDFSNNEINDVQSLSNWGFKHLGKIISHRTHIITFRTLQGNPYKNLTLSVTQPPNIPPNTREHI